MDQDRISCCLQWKIPFHLHEILNHHEWHLVCAQGKNKVLTTTINTSDELYAWNEMSKFSIYYIEELDTFVSFSNRALTKCSYIRGRHHTYSIIICLCTTRRIRYSHLLQIQVTCCPCIFWEKDPHTSHHHNIMLLMHNSKEGYSHIPPPRVKHCLRISEKSYIHTSVHQYNTAT